MTQTFGDFNEEMPTSEEYLVLGFSPSSVSIKQRWRNNGLSADFLADYLTTFFPGSDEDPHHQRRQVEFKGSVSYIANELLENAMKFHDENSKYPINIKLQLHNNKVVFLLTNSIHPQAVEKFQNYLHKLTTSDLEELYISQLEKNAAEETHNGSGLGLLTMLHDYLVKMGWKFETVQTNPQVITVTTMVQLAV